MNETSSVLLLFHIVVLKSSAMQKLPTSFVGNIVNNFMRHKGEREKTKKFRCTARGYA